jgi:general secretion pathway protein E
MSIHVVGGAEPPARATALVICPLSDSGPLAASSEERKLLCLLDDGRLLVAEGYEMSQ